MSAEERWQSRAMCREGLDPRGDDQRRKTPTCDGSAQFSTVWQRHSSDQSCGGNARHGIAKAQYGPEQRRNSKDVKCVVAAEKSSPQQGTAVA